MYYKEIYQSVLKNKEEFDIQCVEYFDSVVKPIWIAGGRKKLDNLTPMGRGIERNIDAKRFLKSKSKIKNTAFAFFVSADLTNCNKYFFKDDLTAWSGRNDFLLLRSDFEFGGVETADYDNSVSIQDLSYIQTRDYHRHYTGRVNKIQEEITNSLKISSVEELLPIGYTTFNQKHLPENSKVPTNLKNKMLFLMWKKQLNNKKITAKHFKDLTKTNFGDFKVEAFNEFFKNKDLIEKKYFTNYVKKEWFYNIKNSSLALSQWKLKQLSTTIESTSRIWAQEQIIQFIENTNVKESNMSGSEFVNWVDEVGVLGNIKFNENESGFFTKTRFLDYLKELYIKD